MWINPAKKLPAPNLILKQLKSLEFQQPKKDLNGDQKPNPLESAGHSERDRQRAVPQFVSEHTSWIDTWGEKTHNVVAHICGASKLLCNS